MNTKEYPHYDPRRYNMFPEEEAYFKRQGVEMAPISDEELVIPKRGENFILRRLKSVLHL